MIQEHEFSIYQEYQPLTKHERLVKYCLNQEIVDIKKTIREENIQRFYSDRPINLVFEQYTWAVILIEFISGLIVSLWIDESIGSVIIRVERSPDGTFIQCDEMSEDINESTLISVEDETYSRPELKKLLGSRIEHIKILKNKNRGIHYFHYAILIRFNNQVEMIYTTLGRFLFKESLDEDFWNEIKQTVEIS